MTDSTSLTTTAEPKWLKTTAIIALIWNLLGIMAFVAHLMMTPAMLAELPDAERALYETAPSWLVYAFGLAVIAGTLGCIALVMKKAWAVPLFIASLIGVLAQNTHSFLLSNTFDVYGTSAMIMPAMVIVIAFLLVWLAITLKNKAILT